MERRCLTRWRPWRMNPWIGCSPTVARMRFMQAVEDGEPGAVAFAAEIDERAARLGATDADLRKAIRAAGTRRGMLPTMH